MKTGADWSVASEVSQISQPAYENAGKALYGEAVSMHGDYAVIGSPGYTCAFVLRYDSQMKDTQ
ncbi:MAG: hypothetical protein GF331_05860 [Chitinivibrionales bacterium]|nr:hypothetical protein [Chitinivibrionales bacterium]